MTALPMETSEYRDARAVLLEAEIALKEQRERVAELRRKLPRDTAVEDYLFHEGARDLRADDEPLREIRLTELFEDPDKPLILMQFMFGGAQTEPCPMCAMWADGYDRVLPHLRESVNFGVVFAGDVGEMRAWARTRGWGHVRLLSSAGTSFKRDLGFESEDGAQMPGVSVFTRSDEGRPQHFYTCGAVMSPEHFRGMDLLSPVWNFLDLTPAGRGDFMPRQAY